MAIRRRALFGGAMEVDLPPRFSDLSGITDVPDHQECFVDASTDQSAVLEINVRT